MPAVSKGLGGAVGDRGLRPSGGGHHKAVEDRPPGALLDELLLADLPFRPLEFSHRFSHSRCCMGGREQRGEGAGNQFFNRFFANSNLSEYFWDDSRCLYIHICINK
jgi:hypothetical protein